MPPNTTLALLAHDRQKDALADFALDHRAVLTRFTLVATAGSGLAVAHRARLAVRLLGPGAAGGDEQMGRLARDNEVQAVIFLRDPMGAGLHEPDFAGLLRVCDAQEIPLATNRATAAALLYFLTRSPDRGAVIARTWGRVPASEIELGLGGLWGPAPAARVNKRVQPHGCCALNMRPAAGQARMRTGRTAPRRCTRPVIDASNNGSRPAFSPKSPIAWPLIWSRSAGATSTHCSSTARTCRRKRGSTSGNETRQRHEVDHEAGRSTWP